MTEITKEMCKAWEEIYIPNGPTTSDKHNKFAEQLNIQRYEAKELCYRIAYSYEFIRGLMQAEAIG